MTAPAPPRRRLVSLAVVVVLAATGVGGYVWHAGGRAAADRDEGLRRARSADFAAAEPLLAAAFARNPADAEVVEALARGYDAADDPRADELLTKWVELAPDRPDPLQARMAYYHRHKDARAYPDARRLSDLDPGDDKARRKAMNLAFTYGRVADSEAMCREALARHPKDSDLRRLLAQTRRAQGDPAGAAAVLDDLLKDRPDLSGPKISRAELHLAAGEPEKAIPLLKSVFDSDPPQRRGAGYALARALEQTGQPAEAARVRAEVSRLQDVELAVDAINTQPDNLDLRVRLAVQLLAAGHTADGLRLLNQVLALDPRFPPAHRALADHYARTGDAARAADHRRLAGS